MKAKNTYDLLIQRAEELAKERDLAEQALFKTKEYHGINHTIHQVNYYQMELAIIDRLEAELDWLISQSNSLEE